MALVDEERHVAPPEIRKLREGLRGDVLVRGDSQYDQARRVWNAMADRRPAVIARCSGVADIVRALEFARAHDLLVAVRGGGHSVPGFSTCDGGIVIDLSPMTGVIVDPQKQTARAQGGVTWGLLDRETQQFSLATTGGVVSTTGIAGLTLGGGRGWLMRKFGLACDNLLSVDLVAADGEFLRASLEENGDLFWGLRGGGGNFGIATAFEYRLHQVGPVVLGGTVACEGSFKVPFLKEFRDFAATAPDELSMQAAMVQSDGQNVCGVTSCYAGPIEEGEKILEPLRQIETPHADSIQPFPYLTLQSGADETFPPGQFHYTTSMALDDLTDEAIEILADHWDAAPSPRPWLVLEHMGGAIATPPKGGTAYAQRDALFEASVWATWTDQAQTDQFVEWSRALPASLARVARGDAYVNYLDAGGEDAVEASYRGGYARLQSLKDRYDPDNLFRLNQNITPSRAG